jgi:hypothetical protein
MLHRCPQSRSLILAHAKAKWNAADKCRNDYINTYSFCSNQWNNIVVIVTRSKKILLTRYSVFLPPTMSLSQVWRLSIVPLGLVVALKSVLWSTTPYYPSEQNALYSYDCGPTDHTVNYQDFNSPVPWGVVSRQPDCTINGAVATSHPLDEPGYGYTVLPAIAFPEEVKTASWNN